MMKMVTACILRVYIELKDDNRQQAIVVNKGTG